MHQAEVLTFDADAFFNPDALVTGHPEGRQAEQVLSHPTLIAEILSDSTAACDRGNIFAACRSWVALQESAICVASAIAVNRIMNGCCMITPVGRLANSTVSN